MVKQGDKLLNSKGKSYLVPFALITICFALWGFANDITNPMVKAFSKIFRMSVTDGALVQVAFYGGYFAMAFPAAMYITRHSYRSGVLMGLGLYAAGALLFYPAMMTGSYYPFLAAYFVMTCGLSFLETSCNPYVLSMGPETTATRRLTLAQSFNPVGSLAGMWVAMTLIQARLDPRDSAERMQLNDAEFAAVRDADLLVLITPYLYIGLVVLLMIAIIALVRMPRRFDTSTRTSAGATMRRLWKIAKYREGVVAQFFYVGAQIMCWTFIIQYGTRVFMAEGMDEKAAEILSQRYNIVAMVLFCCGRFVCTYLMRYIRPARLLTFFACGAAALTAGVIFADGRAGLYCLVGVSGFMSLMFPTIYGIALTGLGDDAKLGSAGLIMAILGGSLLPPLQARIIDAGTVMGMPGVNASFVLPLVSFLVIIAYGIRSHRSEETGRK